MKKILLLHGWNYKNYTNLTDETDAWHNRKDFVELLSKYYEIYKLNFPGFCGEAEPKKGWNLSDYATYVKNFLNNNELKVDYILGYSFGGAVAIEYNRLFDNNQKLILVSPAITRVKSKSKEYVKTPSFLKPLRDSLRDLYLIYIIKNNYMKYGTKFLRKSYQNIVRIELLNSVKKINPQKLLIIYGDNDKMVNPKYVISSLPDNFQNRIFVIKDGGHNIAQTNTSEVVNIIKSNCSD